ncbi:MAG: glycosyltransferase family 39 protein [Lachnospiraceae bacterium]|nr:glycosyltransferase family 39 protein [Lachnospiraceae bacterium]
MKIKMERMKRIMIIIIIIQFVFMLYYCCQKDFFDGDEMFSYSLSNGNFTPFLRWNGDWWNQWHDVDYLTEQITVSAKEAFNYGSVVYNQTQDVHPPVFYCILHTICSLDQEHFSKWQGLSVNLLFYVLTLVIIYKIAGIILKDEFLAVVPMLAYGLSAGAVTTVIYIRMYMLLAFLCVLDVYLHILLLGKHKYRKRILLAVFLTTVVGGLTQYYFLVFAFISSMIYCVLEFSKNIKEVFYYGLTRISSVIVSVMIFPSAITQTTTGSRGISNITNAYGNLSDVDKWNERFLYYVSFIDRQLYAGIGLQTVITVIAIFVVVLLISDGYKIILLHIIQDDNKKTIYLLCLSLLYLFFVINYAPEVGKGFRYITNLYPAMWLCTCCTMIKFIVRMVKRKYLKSILTVFCLGNICVSIFTNKTENIEYLHSSNTEVISRMQNYGTTANFFVNKSDLQEYSFWMQYQNMQKKKRQRFLITTYDRIFEMDDEYLNQMIYDGYDNGILVYIITSYNQQEAEGILDEIIGRTQLKEREYVGTVDGERIFFCRE